MIMLNEILEYDNYLCGDLRRIPLQKRMLSEHLTGIRRPLQVLARGFLEKCLQNDLSPETAPLACKAFLYAWMTGQLQECTDSLPAPLREECQRAADNSFLRYASLVSAADQSELLIKKAQECCKSPYAKKALSKENTFNQLYFDYIIADALYFGPLQAQCLALKDSASGKPYGLTGSDKDRKIALAVVGQYLQIRKRIGDHPQREFIPIVQGEIGNWVNVRSKSGGKAKNGTAQTSVAGTIAGIQVAATQEPLFEKQLLENNMKLRVASNWLAQQQVQLIPVSAAQEYRSQGFLVITDEDLLVTRRSK